MGNLYKMSEEEKEKYNLPLEENYYSFIENEEMFGFAKINYLKKPDVYIFIFEDKRGCGYGNELFSKVLQNIKEYGFHSFEMEFPLENVIMARIVKKNGGIEDTRKENVVKYVIPVL